MGALLALLPMLTPILDKILPDKGAADQAKLELMRMAQNGELAQLTADTQIAVAQAEINKIEAANSSIFVSGWRPAVGWCCALALFFKYIGGPMLAMIAAYFGKQVALPDVGTEDLMVLLGGMLGLGGFRTIEKIKKVA